MLCTEALCPLKSLAGLIVVVEVVDSSSCLIGTWLEPIHLVREQNSLQTAEWQQVILIARDTLYTLNGHSR
jgi:hypothetical protein